MIWQTARSLLALLVISLLLTSRPTQAQTASTTDEAARRAITWLRWQQNEDGGYGDVGATVAVLQALGDLGEKPETWRLPTGRSILDYLAPRAATFASQDASSAGRLVVALVAAGLDPRAFANLNVVSRLQAHFDPVSGVYGGRVGTPLDQGWALLALAAVREPAPETIVDTLLRWEGGSGGWRNNAGIPDVETTALVAAALVSVGQGPGSPVIGRATSFLSSAQTVNGGFTRLAGCGCSPDTRSTARATQAVLVMDGDPLTSGWRRPAGTPADWLRFRQDANGGLGLVPFAPADVLSTAYGVSALLGRPLVPRGPAPATRSGLVWLRSRLTTEGGFASVGTQADVDLTLEAVYALAALGHNPNDWRRPSEPSIREFLRERAGRSTAADLGRLIVAVVALGDNPRQFFGVDLLRRLEAFWDADDGGYGPTASDQAWALLALASVHQPFPPKALDYLVGLRLSDGGWRARTEGSSDTLTTALALQALALDNAYTEAWGRGRLYLLQRQQPDGGFSVGPGSVVSSTSATAAAIQALLSLGETPDSLAWTRHATRIDTTALTAHTPPRFLWAQQNAEGGFRPQPDFPETDALATVRALMAIAGRPHPVARETLRLFLPFVAVQYP